LNEIVKKEEEAKTEEKINEVNKEVEKQKETKFRGFKELETFPEKIKAFRETLGLTQEEFGEVCGLSQKQISHYETGTEIPSLVSFARMVRAFHINPSQFF